MKKIAIYAVAAMLAISGAANAAPAVDNIGPTLTYDETQGTGLHGMVTIEGTLDGVVEGELVSLTVYEKGKTVAESLKWYDQQFAGKDGAYSFDCVLEGTDGVEYIFAIAADEHFGEAGEFKYYPKAKATEVVGNIEGGTMTVSDAITNYGTFLQLDTTTYDGLTDKSAVDASVQTELEKITNPTAADLKEVFADCCEVQEMNEILPANDADYETKLTKVAAEEAPKVLEIFEDLGTDADAIVDAMNDDTYASKDELVADFTDQVLSKAANNALVAAEMEKVVVAAGIDVTAYTAKMPTIMSEMLKVNTYTDAKSITDKFTAVAASIPNPPAPGSSSTPTYSSPTSSMPAPTVIPDAFPDLSSVNWAKDSIRKLKVRGVISGDENGNFNPNSNVTRAEFVKMLVSAMNMQGLGTGLSFEDVNADAWYYDYIIAGAENGLVSGMTEASFGPNLPITRQDASVIIHRAATIKNVNLDAIETNNIADESEIASYAKDAVKALYASNLLNGVGEGKFAPKNNMTRAQAAVIMCSFLERMEATN